MRYVYESSFANYKLAQRAHTRSTWQRRFRWHFFMWGMLLCGLCIMMFSALNRGMFFSEVIGPVLVGGLIGGGIVSPLLRPWQLRRSYRMWNGDDADGRQVYVEMDGPLLVSGIEGKSESRFQRSAIIEVVEDNRVLLLYVRKKVFLYFANDTVPQEALAEIRSWLGRTGSENDAH